MKVAVIGSRTLTIRNLKKYLPENVTEIVSGGAKGIDSCAKQYALANQIKLTEFLPQYHLYGKAAPIKRNVELLQYADCVIAFWDGTSHGTKFSIEFCRRHHIPLRVYLQNP